MSEKTVQQAKITTSKKSFFHSLISFGQNYNYQLLY